MQELASDIVVVGASAGGLDPLGDLIKSIPNNANVTVILAQHLSPKSDTMLAEILGRQSQKPVALAKAHTPITPGNIYVVPPGYNAKYVGGALELIEVNERTRATPNIDLLFESMIPYSQHCVAVILSGSGSDGSVGIGKLGMSGARVMVQRPKLAKFDSMPKAALSAVPAAFQLDPRDFWKAYLDRTAQPQSSAASPSMENLRYAVVSQDESDEDLVAATSEEVSRDIKYLFDLIQHQVGVNFNCYKLPSVMRRLARYMSNKGLAEVSDIFNLLENSKDQARKLVHDLLIPVTTFYRDDPVWEIMKDRIQEIIERSRPFSEIRAWVTACSTGEEAYTLAFLLASAIENSKKSLTFKLFATDIDAESIEFARVGRYSAERMENLPPEWTTRYFSFNGNDLEVRKPIREQILFSTHDLIENPPFFRMDIVTCRNVLIYLRPVFQDYVLGKLMQSLNRDGVLLLGKSESLRATDDQLECLNAKMKIYRKLTDKRQARSFLATRSTSSILENVRFSPNRSLSSSMELRLIETFLPPTIILDENLVIIHSVGDLGEFVTLKPGPTSQKITNIVIDQLQTVSVMLLGKLRKQKNHELMAVKSSPQVVSESLTVVVEARIIKSKRDVDSRIYGLSFQKVESTSSQETVVLNPNEASKDVVSLEEELIETKHYIANIIEELEGNNEELQSLNEELQASNEELQSTNEEMESTNEELQASNEELNSLNDELSIKTKLLEQANMEVNSILNHIGFPLIVVDFHYIILHANYMAEKNFSGLYGSVGRSLHETRLPEEFSEVRRIIDEAFDKGSSLRKELKIDQQIYVVKASAFYDQSHKLSGVVISLINETELITMRHRLANSEAEIRAFFEHSNSIIAIKDMTGAYKRTNYLFSRLVGQEPTEIIGKTDFNILPDKVARRLQAHDIEAYQGSEVKVVREKLPTIEGNKVYMMSRFTLKDDQGRIYGLGMLGVDFTDSEIAEGIIKKQRDAINKASKMKLIGELSGGIAHEINTPISVIIMEAEVLANSVQKGKLKEERLTKGLERIGQLGRSIAEITKALRMFARGNVGEDWARVTVDELLEPILPLTQLRAQEKYVDFQLDVSEPELQIECQPGQIRIVLMNLINNAFDAVCESAVKIVGVKIDRLDPDLRFVISDTGPGIPPELREQIFEPFFTTKDVGKGTGLGLSLSYGLIKAHRGSLRLETKHNLTTFVLNLPITRPIDE